MRFFILSLIFATAAFVVSGERLMDYSLAQLVNNNDKLTQINVERKKVANFVERWGYFFGYLIEEIIWCNKKFAKAHDHSDSHSGTMIIETEAVTHLEQFNGYLDYMIDTSKMDSILS